MALVLLQGRENVITVCGHVVLGEVGTTSSQSTNTYYESTEVS